MIPGVVDAPILPGHERILIDESGGAKGLGRIINAAKAEAGKEGDKWVLEGEESELGSLPLVVFTHGMAGMSQSYSHYLGSIASHGYVVAAVERAKRSSIVGMARGSARGRGIGDAETTVRMLSGFNKHTRRAVRTVKRATWAKGSI